MNIYVYKTSKIYKNAGKCDDQQQYKDIIEAATISAPEGYNEKIMMTPNQSDPTKNTSARKPLVKIQKNWMSNIIQLFVC